MKYIYTQTHRTTACSYLTPQARMTFTKLTAFSDLEKVSIWVCVMELQTFITYCTHKLPFAVKIQIPISYDWEGEHARQGSGSIIHLLDSVKVMHMIIIRIIQTNICPCLSLPGKWLSCVFPVLWLPHNTQIPLSPFSTFSLSHNPVQKYQTPFFPFSVSTQVFPARSVSTLPTPFPLLERNSQSAPQLVQATWALRQSQNPKLTNERDRPAYGRTHPCASTLSQLKHFVLRVEDVI